MSAVECYVLKVGVDLPKREKEGKGLLDLVDQQVRSHEEAKTCHNETQENVEQTIDRVRLIIEFRASEHQGGPRAYCA